MYFSYIIRQRSVGMLRIDCRVSPNGTERTVIIKQQIFM